MNWFWDGLAAIFCGLFGTCVPVTPGIQSAPTAPNPKAPQADCSAMVHRGNTHTVCSFALAEVTIRTHLLDTDKTPYRTLRALEGGLTAAKKPPAMVMNGGMYHADLAAVGLYVEGGKQVAPVSTKGGWGNFHLLPNGVFWVKGNRVGVTETRAFLAQDLKPDYATQSGPMLVIAGKLHQRFLKNSDSLKIRNGVGLSADGQTVHFAISQGPVSFHDFGTLFRDRLKTPDALYLDGTVSAIRAGPITQGGWRELGPMISVTKR